MPRDLLDLVRRYALSSVESDQEERAAPAVEVLMRGLADHVRQGTHVTPGRLLESAVHSEPQLFRSWTAKRVSSSLHSYGVVTQKTRGQRLYRDVTLEQLATIERNYGLDLGFTPEAEEPTPASAPSAPGSPL